MNVWIDHRPLRWVLVSGIILNYNVSFDRGTVKIRKYSKDKLYPLKENSFTKIKFKVLPPMALPLLCPKDGTEGYHH